jgi:hypothetical protein
MVLVAGKPSVPVLPGVEIVGFSFLAPGLVLLAVLQTPETEKKYDKDNNPEKQLDKGFAH